MKKLISWSLRHIPRTTLQYFSHYILKIAGVLLRGKTYYCPINEKGYRKFLPYGRINPRPNALCPDTLSLERHRLIWLFLKRKTDFFSSKPIKMLHIAPELCFINHFKRQGNLEYITGDLESPLADYKFDLHQIPFENETFDMMMCNHVMEHVKDDIQCMRELYRILKKGGWGIVQVPFFEPIPKQTKEDKSITNPKEREKAYGQDDHVRLYGKDYADRLRQAGFEVEESKFVFELSADEVKKYALPSDEIIYLCRKP